MEIASWIWSTFGITLLVLLFIDLYSHRGGRESSHAWAVAWSVIWVGAGLAFAVFVWRVIGGTAANEYLAAYFIEKSLSLDNMFVFLVVFQTLKIPKENQRTALSWGIFGALVFRAAFILAGTAALERWSWVNYVFGGILFLAAIHMFRENPSEAGESGLANWLSHKLPVSKNTETRHFFLSEQGIRKASPLLVAIIALELADILFAIDSVPAAFAVTREPFLIYTSNAFAILGLRSLYAVVAELVAGLRYLHYGLAAILGFAGVKVMFSDVFHIPPLLSVVIIIAMVGIAAAASLYRPSGSSRHVR